MIGNRNPTACDRNVPNIPGEDKRQNQGKPENAQIKNSQLRPLRPDALVAPLLPSVSLAHVADDNAQFIVVNQIYGWRSIPTRKTSSNSLFGSPVENFLSE